MNKKTFVFAFFCILTLSVFSQTSGIIVDKETRQPISYVTIYTKNGESVFGTMSDEHGRFSLNFPFRQLFISHINYQKLEMKKENLTDTIFMTPSSILLNEVIVSNKQPRWITRILNEIVRQKGKNYQTSEKQFTYNYESYTLGDSSGYAFKSNGKLMVPKLSNNSRYYIDAQNNTIKYKDKTAGVDFSNLKRMLYDDFISSLNTKFIADNNFSLNRSFVNRDRNKVQLNFISKKYKDFDGYLVVDTLNKVILEVERNGGTAFNIKTQTQGMLRNLISSRIGFNYNTWITKNITMYTKIGQAYYMSECKYKFAMKTTTKNKKVDKKYFTSIESELNLMNDIKTKSKELKIVPKPYYLVLIMSKQMRQEENAFNNVPVKFEKF